MRKHNICERGPSNDNLETTTSTFDISELFTWRQALICSHSICGTGRHLLSGLVPLGALPLVPGLVLLALVVTHPRARESLGQRCNKELSYCLLGVLIALAAVVESTYVPFP